MIRVGRYNSSGQFVGTSTWRYFEFTPIPNAAYTIQVKNNFSNEVYFIGFSKDGTETLITSFNAKTVTFNSQNFTKIGYSVEENELDNCQLEKGSTATDYEEHKEQKIVLDIQQEMLTGDYFDLDRKKEVHNWNKITLKGTETIERIDTQASGKYRFAITVNDIQPVASDTSALAVINNLVSERLKVGSNNDTYINRKDSTMHMRINGTKQIIVYIENCSQMSVTEFKAFLQEQYNAGTPVEIWYKLATTTELDLTEAQIKALEQLNKLRFYKNVNNIFTLEDIALLQATYSVDIQTKLNNINNQLLEMGGN